jgi:hypothetical protein
MGLDLKKARKELAEKNLEDIQEDTAWTWASRSVVSFENVLKASKKMKLAFFIAGQEYYHEAVEHASLVDDKVLLVQEVKEAIEGSAQLAVKDIHETLGIDL